MQDKFSLGNLEARRDWGFAGDYVIAMWLMMQYKFPHDFVIATGETHSVKEFLQVAFSHVGLDCRDYVVVDSTLFRPAEVDVLRGDSSKIKKMFRWEPKVGFEELVKIMVDNDCNQSLRSAGGLIFTWCRCIRAALVMRIRRYEIY